MCQATGWSWDEVEDRLTIPRLHALARHWAETPPPHLLLRVIAQALGWRPARKTDTPDDSWKDLMELAADPRSGIALRGKPPS